MRSSKATSRGVELGAKNAVLSEEITECKLAENALNVERDLAERYLNIVEVIIVALDTNARITLLNRKGHQVLGYEEGELIGKDWIRTCLRPQEHQQIHEVNRKINAGEIEAFEYYENYVLTKKGEERFIAWHTTILKDDNGRIIGTLSSGEDITERKRAEEALRSSNQIINGIINAIPVRVFWKDRNSVFLGCNKIFAQDAGFADPSDIIGKDDYQMGWHDQAELYRTDDRQVIESGQPKLLIEEPQTTPNGDTIVLLTSKIPLRNFDGEIIGVLGTYMDITDRKQAEDKIMASLREKEVLLKEIHHRVKNNLQVISALLYLQSLNLTDDNVVKIFRDCQDRIKSMALIHENLYRSKDLEKVDFNEYIEQLAAYLSQSYGNLAGKINFKVNSENVYLNVNTAIPCGMIINELVSNSLKYAFPDGRTGEVSMDLSSEDDSFKLVISDNGVGINEGLNVKESKTLGFRLIDTLVKQIDGEMSFNTTNGTRYEIRFKGLK